ncbi:hypothetical protein BH09MYX1_BH09MYX1_24440 [soil metagenome]
MIRWDAVDLLSLDAGNSVIFLDHARLARFASEAGFVVSAERLIVTEGEAKRMTGDPASMVDPPWQERRAPGAAGWGRMVATMLARANDGRPIAEAALAALVSRIWESHVDHNFWSVVPEGFVEAIADLRRTGVKTAIVSNSEGMLDRLFSKLGIADCFDAVIDSGRVGVEKPDAEIFRIACERTGTTAARALHLGDTYTTDVVGARNAGIATALIDPYAHYEGLYPDVERVAGVVSVARAITAARATP